jgi:hypothetical protein
MDDRRASAKVPGMTSWNPQRGVFLYRPRLGAGNRPLPLQEPAFPWLVMPLFGLGFALFFAGLALIGIDSQLWEGLLAAVGMGLVAAAAAVLAKRFL